MGTFGGDGAGGGGSDPLSPGEGGLPAPTAKVGLGIFLAVPTLLFSALVSAYVVRMGLPDWRSLSLPDLLWVNTGLLAVSSGALHWAMRAARRERAIPTRAGLIASGFLTVLFVLGQLGAWQRLAAAGVFLDTNPSSSFFYLITALHGVHVLGGLVAWGRTTARAWLRTPWANRDRNGSTMSSVRTSVELCTMYWHFLLVVWLAMFALISLT